MELRWPDSEVVSVGISRIPCTPIRNLSRCRRCLLIALVTPALHPLPDTRSMDPRSVPRPTRQTAVNKRKTSRKAVVENGFIAYIHMLVNAASLLWLV